MQTDNAERKSRGKRQAGGQAHRAVKRNSHKRHKTPTFCCLVVVRHTRCITKRIHKSRTFQVVASLCRTDRLLTLGFPQPVAHGWRARQAQIASSNSLFEIRVGGPAVERANFFLLASLFFLCWRIFADSSDILTAAPYFFAAARASSGLTLWRRSWRVSNDGYCDAASLIVDDAVGSVFAE